MPQRLFCSECLPPAVTEREVRSLFHGTNVSCHTLLLEYFPEYDRDIENAYYINDSEGETLMFCDYNVEREHVEAFKNKLGASGFIKEPSSGSTVYWYNNTGTYSLRIGIDDYETYVIIELTRLA